MSVPDDRQFKKQFSAVIGKISRNNKFTLEEKLILHKGLLEACMKAVQQGSSSAYIDYKTHSGFHLLPSSFRKSIAALIENAFQFRDHPAVIASLYEFKPEPTKAPPGETSKYGERHGERRKSGRFYTPLNIAVFMAELSVNEYHGDVNKKITDLKILDPSSGGGIFLNAIYLSLKKREMHPQAIIKSIYAIDQDPEALELTKWSLTTCTGGIKSERSHFLHGDFLLDELKHPDSGYDLIIGNPPYISYYSREAHGDEKKLKSRLDKRYGNAAGGSLNTFLHFIVRSIELLKDHGMLCFIVPDKILWNRRYRRIREYIIENAPPVAIIKTGENVFQNATVGNVILLLEKKSDPSRTCLVADTVEKAKSREISITGKRKFKPADFFLESEYRFMIPDKLVTQIENGSIPLGKLAHVRDGINTAFGEFRESVVSAERKGSCYRPLIEGQDIHPFTIRHRQLFINYCPEIVTKALQTRGVSFREPWIFNAPYKLVNRQTSDRLIFALDQNQSCDLNSVHNTILRDGFENLSDVGKIAEVSTNKAKFHLEFLNFICGILNSRLMNFYYRSTTQETARSFPQVHIADLKELPIRVPDQKKFVQISQLAQRLSESAENKAKYLVELDQAVYELYDISSESRVNIEKETGLEWR